MDGIRVVSSNLDGGFAWQALQDFKQGSIVFQEKPLVSCNMQEHIGDPDIVATLSAIVPYLEQEPLPPAAVALIDKVAEQVAVKVYKALPNETQQRWMALHDAFSPEGSKAPEKVWRTNAFARDAEGGGLPRAYMFEVLSRVNHSCAPNIAKDFQEDGTAVVRAVRNIASGEELFLCYMPDELLNPTKRRREQLQRRYNFLCACERCGPCPS